LQYSNPSRIQEATPYIEKVLAHFAVEKPGEPDVIPLLYHGVALHKVPGQENAALNAFTTAFDHGVDIGSTKTMLWARGSMSRLLRRMGRVPEAEEQEKEIRSELSFECVSKSLISNLFFFFRTWLRFHEFGMPQSDFIKLVTDPDHTGIDYIMEHPEMQKMRDSVVDLGNGMAVHFG
jgi:hypothetical protein